ncbi:DNA polymerase III PolC-type [Thalassocella blandensis]|nr:DNA polymerase III PolC-type [Thalassocella blandensis]
MGLYQMFHYIQRKRFAEKARNRPLSQQYFSEQIAQHHRIHDTEFLVIDCEMSGLKASKNQLLSIGWVTIKNLRIVNASCKYFLTHSETGTGDTTKIHGLMESNIAGATSIASVLLILIKHMQDKVLVFHHAPLDIAFLQRAALHHFQCPFLFSYIDTLNIEQHRLQLQGKHGGLRLAQCRERYGLLSNNQHNALADAYATAELLLAQASYLGDKKTLTLKSLRVHSTCHWKKAH